MKKTFNNKKIKKQSNVIYNESLEKYGINSRAVLWDNPQTQYFRFAELTKELDFNDPDMTILDVGCGNCEMYKFLNFVGFRGHYTGFDINEKLLEQARKRFNEIDVRLIDIMEDSVSGNFNFVLMSGMFNKNVGQCTEWCYTFIKKMFEICSKRLIFNGISTYVNYRSEGMFYLDPLNTVKFCIENLSPRVTLTHHNLPYNFTISAFKGIDWRSI